MIPLNTIKETNDFLDNVVTPSNSFITGDQQFLAVSDTSQAGDKPVTGVVEALLPMVFRIGDKNGDPISFTLLVNPESLNHGKTTNAQAVYTRKGFVVQLWGPNQDTFSATGKTGGFVVDKVGYSSLGQRKSVAFKNLMALMAVYRNNGCSYFDPWKGTDEVKISRVINVVHGVEVYYDGCIFMGHFNNFTLDNDAERPFSMSVNFEFVVTSLNAGAVDGYSEVYGHFTPIGMGSGNSTSNFLDQSTRDNDKNVAENLQRNRQLLLKSAQDQVISLKNQLGVV